MIDPLTPTTAALRVIPESYFFAPYWLLDIFLLLSLGIGIAIGLLAAYGPAQLRYKVCTIWLKLTS
jgi:hypothetical protein